MFNEYLLDTQAHTNLIIFKYLKSHDTTSVTVAELAKALDSSYSKAQHALNTILADLATMQNIPLEDAPAKMAGFRQLAANISREDYRRHLLTDSLVFKLFNAIFQGDNVDIADFATSNDSSVSTIRRKAEPLRDFLLDNGIVYDTKNSVISGNEVNIRTFLAAFYTDVYGGTTWPFRTIDQDRIIDLCTVLQQKRDELGGEHLDYIPYDRMISLAVQLLRMQQGHYYVMNAAVNSLRMLADDIDELIFTSVNFPEVPPRTLLAEQNYFYFTEIIRLNYSGSDSCFQQGIRAFFARSNNPVGQFVSKLLQVLKVRLDQITFMEIENNKSTVTNLYRMAYAYYAVGADFTDINYLHAENQQRIAVHPLCGIIDDMLSTIPLRADTHVFKRFAPRFTRSLALLILPTVGHYAAQPMLTARLSLDFIDSDVLDAMAVLENGGWVRQLPSSSNAEADVVITTATQAKRMLSELEGNVDPGQLPARNENQRIIYWNTAHTARDLKCLYDIVIDLAHKKLDYLTMNRNLTAR